MRRQLHIVSLALIASILLNFPIDSGSSEQAEEADEDLLKRIESLETRYRTANEELQLLRHALDDSRGTQDADDVKNPRVRVRQLGVNVVLFPIHVLHEGVSRLLDTTSATYTRVRDFARSIEDEETDPRWMRRYDALLANHAMRTSFDARVGRWRDITFVDLTPDLARIFGIERGVLVTHTGTDASALQDGDVVLAIGEHAPADAAHAVALLRESEGRLPLSVWREGRALRIQLE